LKRGSGGSLVLAAKEACPAASAGAFGTVWVQILSQGRDLGIVQVLPDDGALKMNALK
jgi:hypothetical protein